jgi:hypothetical protein
MTRSRLVLAITLVAVLVAAPTSATHAQEDGHHWPFGLEGAGPGFRGKDLYNLGLLGVKARDPARAAAPSFGQGKRQASSADAGSMADVGPNRLLVEIVFPDGPAARAGLVVGDVIVGAGRAFKDGSLAPLSAALIKAESGKGKGMLGLRVERGGEGKAEKVDVPIPQGGKEAAKPHEGAARQALFEKAAAWLAAEQQSSGGFAETLSGANGAVVQTSLAGLTWLAGGSDLENGPYKDNVKGAMEFVIANVGVDRFRGGGGGGGGTSDEAAVPTEPSWDQTNWGYAHAAIFLGELHQRTSTDELKSALIECGRTLARRQEKSGGWAHGPGGKNALGYVELNIVSGLALCGIGLAGQAGYEVPEEVIAKAEEYLSTSGGGDGGVAYSDKGGQRGQGNIGRTAGAWLGFRDLGLGSSKWTKKMGKYVSSHAGETFGGHASLMQHVLLAGVAAHAQGGKARASYWEKNVEELTIARAPNGSFQPRPWHESLSIGSNSDVSFGQVWTTAAWAIVLGCEPSDERTGLPAWMGLDAK